jgi:beta-glucosidase
LLKKFSKYKKPIIILENGLADASDRYRANFIKEHLYYIYQAMEEGVDVRGYFHWSLLDNFEWAYGWSPKFGLYSVDRKTFERQERPSAETYREICGGNKIVVK